MNLPILLSILATIFFGTLAILFSIQEQKTKLLLEKREKILAEKEKFSASADLKDDFTNMIVHELRAPLAAIKDSSGLILSNKYSLSENEKKQFLEIINRQSRILLNQIGSILDSAKLEAGKFTIVKEKNDLGKVIKEEIELFIPASSKKHISLTSDISKDIPMIFFDSTRISQVINNLLSNSLKFTQEKGSIHVYASFNPISKYIIVSVSDSGIGIPKDFQKNMFSKFAQARTNPQKLSKQGTGLGLYVVKGIVEAHKGKVSVESEQGKGTAISFTLPAGDEIPKAHEEVLSKSFSHSSVNPTIN